MNPLIGLAAAVLPDVIKLIASDNTGQLAGRFVDVVSSTLGTSDVGAAKSKLDADPGVQAALQQKLAELAIEATRTQNAEAAQQRQDQLSQQKMANDNTSDARKGLDALASIHSSIAWTAPVVSYLVIAGFFVFLMILVLLYQYGPKPGPDQNNFIITIINITVGALTAAFATVVNFWLGSSAGSQNKDAAAINLQRTQSENTNAAIDALGKKAAAPVVIPTPPVASPSTGAWPPAKTAKPSNDAADASQRFEACVPYIFRMEGGYSDVQGDRGGPTNFGITLETLKEWEGKNSLTAEDVKALTQEQAKEIYRANYWNKMQCGALPDGLDLEVFDFGVNAGPGRAVKTLQRIVGVTEDGSTGPITLAAVKTFRPDDLVERYTAARLDYYKSLTGEVQFLAGWESRVSQVQIAALKMASSPLQMAA